VVSKLKLLAVDQAALLAQAGRKTRQVRERKGSLMVKNQGFDSVCYHIFFGDDIFSGHIFEVKMNDVFTT
jgi:hypothetical protein